MGYLERVYFEGNDENRRAVLDALLPRPGGSLLDLGCGDGELTVVLGARAQVARLAGVEYVEEVAARAREHGVDVAVADLCAELPFDDASFDVIHSNQVIEHLPCTDHFMREVRRLLKPDGYAVISTNNLSSWHNIVSLVLGWQPPPCHVSDEGYLGNPANPVEGGHAARGQTHLRVFTARALTGLAERHGLRAELELGSAYYPLPSRLARRMAMLDRRHAAFLVHRFVRADGALERAASEPAAVADSA